MTISHLPANYRRAASAGYSKSRGKEGKGRKAKGRRGTAGSTTGGKTRVVTGGETRSIDERVSQQPPLNLMRWPSHYEVTLILVGYEERL